MPTLDELEDILKCPLCSKVPFDLPIYCCRNGHPCCNVCFLEIRRRSRSLSRQPICDNCRLSMAPRKVYRNHAAEQIVAEYKAILSEMKVEVHQT